MAVWMLTEESRRLKDVKMKKLQVKQGVESYSINFGDLATPETDEDVRVLLWDLNQRTKNVNKYTLTP